MSIRNIGPLITESHSFTPSLLKQWIVIFSENWVKYSTLVFTVSVAIIAIGLMFNSVGAFVSTSLLLIAGSAAIHLRLTSRNRLVMADLFNAEERLASEASARRILDGIRLLHGNDLLNADARLAAAARIATDYPAAIVFNLREAHGVLVPSIWNYDGQLAQIRDEFEPVNGNDPAAVAARQGSAIVVSNTESGVQNIPKWAEQSGFSQGIVTPITRGLDTVGVIYVLNKSNNLPSLNEIEQLELIVSFSSLNIQIPDRDAVSAHNAPFRVIDKPPFINNELPATLPIRMPGFALNPDSERMEMDDTMISLSPTEFLLLHALASTPEKPVSPVELMNQCWTMNSKPADNAIDVAIFRLRKKLDKTPSGSGLIKTVRGCGYMFIPPLANNGSTAVAD
ncbi:MAG: winged helix-turn-helix domain-containing protein [Chloroflexi bacterium]|nr:winged helix-turn-helix domain-containing protein [Chloroflexota bacterium]